MKFHIGLALALFGGVTSAQASFTPIAPSPDSLVVYVDRSIGSDTSTCGALQMPCETLTHAKTKMRSGYPDHLYLKRGQDFTADGGVSGWSGRSAEEPAVLAYYGDAGERPRVARVHSFRETNPIENFQAIGLHVMDGANFVWENKGILIEDCLFDKSEVTVQGQNGKNPSDITIRRNIFTGAYVTTSSFSQASRPSNMYLHAVDGLLIEENVFDHGGWHPTEVGAAANMYNHNIYIQSSNVGNNIVVRNNIITRASSHGIHGRPGGLYEDNFFAKNAISLQMGYKDTALSAGTNAIARNNVITEARSMVKGNQPCSGSTLCTAAFWGIETDNPGQGYFEIVGNLIVMGEDNETDWSSIYSQLTIKPLYEDPDIINKKVENNRIEASELATLADYAAYLGLERSFDAFLNVVSTRSPGSWEEKYTAAEINKYLRAQYNMVPEEVAGSPFSGELLSFGAFGGASLQNMPSTYVLGTDASNVWMAREGTCGQCSQVLTSGSNQYLDTGYGTTNGAFQVIAFPGSGDLTLSFDQMGGANVRILGGYSGDTIEKWNNAHTLDLIYEDSMVSTPDWTSESVTIELAGNYDYLVVQFRVGDVDNVSAVIGYPPAQEITSFGDFNGDALQGMPNPYTLGSDPLSVWMARLGTCGQCSQLISNGGDMYLEAGYGSTVGTFQVVPWSGSGTLNLDFDHLDGASVGVFGGNTGDIIDKWSNSHTLDALYEHVLTGSPSWVSESIETELTGDYDYLVIQFRSGNVDNVSATVQ